MVFEPGDVVFLKSGGQAMTVVSIDEENAECVWIGDEGDFFRETLPAIALTKATEEEEEEEE